MAPKLAGFIVAAVVAHAGTTPAQKLPALARALVPTEARSSLDRNDLRPKNCGVSPTYPCIRAFFIIRGTFTARQAALRSQARRVGWRVERSRPAGTGMSLELRRGQVHARYLLERAESITGLEIYGPPNALTGPSTDKRAQWSSEKREYVSRANAVCAQTLGRMKTSRDLAPALTKANRELHALHPPAGEQDGVKSFLRPLDTLVRALRELAQAKGEDALAPAVAVAEYTKRFERAAVRYGLTRCTFH
jgi:hypothetical protein